MQAPDDRREALRQRVDRWARVLKVGPRVVRVQHMTRKWGSCSTSRVITLALDLVDQEPGFQDFVIVHELLHLRVPNHGKLFKALLGAHVPDWRRHDGSRNREAIRRSARPGGRTGWVMRTDATGGEVQEASAKTDDVQHGPE